MGTQRKPVRYNPSTGGFINFQGDDIFWLDYTDSVGNIASLKRSTAEVFGIKNQGEVEIKTTASATDPALLLGARAGTNANLALYDLTLGQTTLTVERQTVTNSWINTLTTKAPNHANAEGLRIKHETASDTPLGKALVIGHTNSGTAWVESFNFAASGAFTLSKTTGANILWASDGGGNIGASGANRPATVFANTAVNAAGSVLKVGEVQLGPLGATDKQITALQSGSSPYIKFLNGSSKWQFSNDGSTPLDFGTSNVNSWDDLYALDTSLTISGSALAFTKTSTTGYGFTVTRNLSSNNAGLVYFDNQNSLDAYTTLSVLTAGSGYCINAINSNTTHGNDKALATTGYAAFNKSIQNSTLSTYYTLVSSSISGSASYGVGNTTVNCFRAVYTRGSVADNASAYIIGFNATGSGASESTQKRAFNADSNWTYGLYSSSIGLFEVSTSSYALTICQNGSSGLLTLRDGTLSSGTNRLLVAKSGYTTLEANSGSGGLIVAQGTPGSALTLKSGTISGGTTVFNALTNGLVQLYQGGGVVSTGNISFYSGSDSTLTLGKSDQNQTIQFYPGSAGSMTINSIGNYNGTFLAYVSSYTLRASGASYLQTSSGALDMTAEGGAITITSQGVSNKTTIRSMSSFVEFYSNGTTVAVNGTGGEQALNTSSTNLIGAINEVNTGMTGTTLDVAYNNSSGASTINVDNGSVTWLTSSTYKHIISGSGITSTKSIADVTAASGALTASQILTGHSISISGHAFDNSTAQLIGQQLSVTPNSSTASMYGTKIGSGWTYGLHSASVGAFEVSTATTALTLCQANASGKFLNLRDGTISSGTDRFTVLKTGDTSLEVNSSSAALTLAQNGAGNTLLLKDGTLSGGTDVYAISDVGYVTHTPIDPTASYVANTITVVNGGLSTAKSTFSGLVVDITGHANDNLHTLVPSCGFLAGYTQGDAPTAMTAGFAAGGDWYFGMYSTSPLFVMGPTTNTPLQTNQTYGLLTVIAMNEEATPAQLITLCDGYDGGGAPDPATFRFSVDQVGYTVVSGTTSIGKELLTLDQNDDDEPFFRLDGVSSPPSDKSANISTGLGTGTVVGPLNSLWTASKMVRVNINGVDGWICIFV